MGAGGLNIPLDYLTNVNARKQPSPPPLPKQTDALNQLKISGLLAVK
jgi:hypothetical protein